MSSVRQIWTAEQEPDLAVRAYSCDFPSGTVVQNHAHAWHQLLFACAGTMSVHAGRECWLVPPGRAVLIPAGSPHSLTLWGTVKMRTLYLSPRHISAEELRGEACRVLSVGALLREIILRIAETAPLHVGEASHCNLISVLLDELRGARDSPLMLVMPTHGGALAAARHVLSQPVEEQSIEHIARSFGMGRRTMERVFREETGMSFGLWRQKMRLLQSIQALSDGASVTEAAGEAGYASVSAYISSFKATFGCTPGRF